MYIYLALQLGRQHMEKYDINLNSEGGLKGGETFSCGLMFIRPVDSNQL